MGGKKETASRQSGLKQTPIDFLGSSWAEQGKTASRQSRPKQAPLDTNMTVGGTKEKKLADRAARSRHQSILI